MRNGGLTHDTLTIRPRRAEETMELHPESLFSLAGKVAIITGATGWLGRAMTRTLAAAGADVHAVARDQGRLEALERELRDELTPIHVAAVDVATAEWPDYLRDVGRQHDRLDVLVNNAHVGHGGSLRTASDDLFDEGYELSVKAAWRAMEAARPWFTRAVAQDGAPAVINVSSMYGLVAPDLSVYDSEEGRTPPYYGVAKAGLLQLTRYAAAELGPEGVRVNALVPGPFPASAAQQDDSFISRLAARTLLGRVGRPEELCTALLFLASPHSTFVTGTQVVVDGGWTAR